MTTQTVLSYQYQWLLQCIENNCQCEAMGINHIKSLNIDKYNYGVLEMHKAQEIIKEEQNYKHDTRLIIGCSRQSTENIHIPKKITKICVLYWGSMRLFIFDKLTQITEKTQNTINAHKKQIYKYENKIIPQLLHKITESEKQLLVKQIETANISKEIEIEMREINKRKANIELKLAQVKPP
eukprot:280178_1